MKKQVQFDVGDVVYIRAKRSPGGSIHVSIDDPNVDDYDIHECVVAQVNVCSVQGCYGLEWADTREPVGVPIFLSHICNESGNQGYKNGLDWHCADNAEIPHVTVYRALDEEVLATFYIDGFGSTTDAEDAAITFIENFEQP